MGIVPFAVLAKIITVNDTIASCIGVLLLISVFTVTKQQLGLFWADVMEEREIGAPIAGAIGAWIVTVAAVIGLLAGIITFLPVTTLGWLCTLAIVAGSILL